MALGSNHWTTTTQDVYIPEVWRKETRRARESNLVMAKLVKRYDTDVIKFGDTVHIPHSSLETASDKSANTVVTFSATTETKTDISINKHKYVAILIEDIVKAQSIVDTEGEARWKIGYGLAKAIDTDLTTLVTDASNTVGNTESDISDDNIIRAIQYLDDADSPDIDRYLLIKPSQWASIMKIDKFVKADSIGSNEKSPIRTYHVGDIYGVGTFKSRNVYAAAGAHNLLWQKDAIGMAMQKNPTIEVGRVIEYLGDAIIGSTIYGVKSLRTTEMVDIATKE